MNRITIALALLFVIGTLVCQAQPGTLQTFSFRGVERCYWQYIPPSYRGDRPVPLLLALHGTGGSGQRHAEDTRYDLLADSDTFIVVHPSGYPYENPCPLDTCMHKWNNKFTSGPLNYPDAEYLLALIDVMSSSFRIDSSRVYLSGFSNGASMAMRMACEHPERFAAIAAHSGLWLCAEDGISGEAEFDCRPAERIPFQFSVGELEPISLTGRDTADVQCRTFWQASNRCFRFTSDTIPVLTATVVRREFLDCAADTCRPALSTQFNTILRTSHGWRSVNSQLAWDFLKRYRRSCTGTATNIRSERPMPSSLERVEVFPNPSRTTCTLRSASFVHAAVVDILGREVWRGDIAGHRELDVSDWAPGMYLLQAGASTSIMMRLP